MNKMPKDDKPYDVYYSSEQVSCHYQTFIWIGKVGIVTSEGTTVLFWTVSASETDNIEETEADDDSDGEEIGYFRFPTE